MLIHILLQYCIYTPEMSTQENSVMEVTPTFAFTSTQEKITVPVSESVIPTSGAPANGTVQGLLAGEVAAIVVSTILVALVIVAVVPAVVATICYIRKCRRKRLLWDSVYSNDQGIRLVTTSAAQPRRSHHLPLIYEGTSAKQESAPSSADPSLGSVQTPETSGEGREDPYSCPPSQYEVVVSHYVAGDVDNVFDGLQQSLNTRQISMASSTPPKTTYTVVPVKAVRLTKSEQTPVHLSEIRTGLDATCVQYEKVPFRPPSVHVDGLYQQLAGRRCLEIPRSVLDMKECIGSGEFGKVYRAVWETPYGPEEVAIKVLKTGTSEEDKVKFLQEAAIMAQFRHPHIVRLLGAVTVDEPTVLVLEYLKLGNVQLWLERTRYELKDNHGCLSTLPHQLLQFCREVADGMKYLSNKGFVHRDLAARNVLLDNDLKCHIGDFGLSCDQTSGKQNISTGKIPIRWTAPEALFQRKFSTHSDVWSYGMLLYEIWSVGRRPFSSLQSQEVVQLLKSRCSPLLPPPPGCPRGVYKMMVQCWSRGPHQRPSFLELLQQISSIEEDSEQLKVPEASLRGLEDPQRAGRLGAPLFTAEQLYKDLLCTAS